MSAENKAIIRRLYGEVWNARRLDLVNEIISPSHALHGTNTEGAAIGPEAYKSTVTRFLTGLPDLRFSIDDMVAEDEKLVVSWNISGTHKGDFMGVPATNKKVSIDGITINHVVNGKIMDSYVSWDALGTLQQLGVAPPFGRVKDAAAR
jgi:steroid delta-isomerase-like uncharacterized protein